jgi:hypothetical protein
MNEFLRAIRGKCMITAEGVFIRKSDMRALEKEFGLNYKGTIVNRPKTFYEANVLAEEEMNDFFYVGEEIPEAAARA